MQLDTKNVKTEVIKMKEKQEIENIFNQLTEDNKEVLNMVAKGMKIAQDNSEVDKHIPRID